MSEENTQSNHADLCISGVSHVVAITSGKGGVGKTTMTVNLALAFRRNGARVGVFDADVHGPNVPAMLGLRPTQSPRFRIPVARVDSTPYLAPLQLFGLKVMSLGFLLGDRDTIRTHGFFAGRMIRQTLLDIIWGELDFLLIDLPPGTGEPQQTLLNTFHVDGAIIVTTPHELSLLDSGRGLGLLRHAKIPILGILENMGSFRCPHCSKPIDLFPCHDQQRKLLDLQLPLLGRIPMNYAIGCRIDETHPLVTESKNSDEFMIFEEITAKIVQRLAEESVCNDTQSS